MKRILFILLTLAIPALLLAAEPVREWKNKSGKTIIEASLDKTKKNDDPEHVYLINKEGKRYKILFEKLSQSDQDYVTRVRQAGRGLDDGDRQNESRAMQLVEASQRYALLIGVNAYPKEDKLKTLPSAVKDMTDLAEALEKYAGFPRENITLMTDDSSENLLPTRENIEKQIAKIRDKLTQNDLLIVAFSGHGVTIDDSDDSEARPYFCVRDTDLPYIDTLLSRDWVFEQIDKCKADRKIFFCDACRTLITTDKLIQIASRSGQSASIRSLQDPSETWGYNYVLMSSCAKGQNSIDTGTNGLFTKYLLEGLRTSAAARSNGNLTAFSWFEYAAEKTETVSERMIKENPALVIGTKNQTQQNPRIVCRGEMSRFVIAKLEPGSGPFFTVPNNVEDLKIREYQVGSLRVQFQSSGSTLLGETIRAGNIKLPPIPDKINELTGEVRGIEDALTRMENGTHEVLREAEQVKIDAQAQYEAIKLRRDGEWKQLPSQTQGELERQIKDQIKESPNSDPTDLADLRPKEVSYSRFIELAEWGLKTEQARLERLRVEDALKVEIQKEINRIKAALADKKQELQTETENFGRSVIQLLLEQTPGWKKPVSEKLDYIFLSKSIPTLLKYPLDWDEEKLFALAKDVWKTKRPCEIERIKAEEKERLERERIAQEEARKHDLSIPGTKAGERKTVTINDVEFAFRWCPAGTFMMGSPTGEGVWRDETQHRVTLTKGFWMMETEVTQKQWKTVMGSNPSRFQGDDLPVGNVNWNDCQEFCTKTGFQLPTEAQWEYACRAGTTGAYAGNRDEMAWYDAIHPVGTKKPNAWGLYDMHGNVWEWCADWYRGDYYSSGSVTDPTGPMNGFDRVLRGGRVNFDVLDCRSACRNAFDPMRRFVSHGFRCVRSITRPEN